MTIDHDVTSSYYFTLFSLGVAALVYIGSWILAGTDFTVGVSIDFRAGTVLASALADSAIFGNSFGGSCGSWN